MSYLDFKGYTELNQISTAGSEIGFISLLASASMQANCSTIDGRIEYEQQSSKPSEGAR